MLSITGKPAHLGTHLSARVQYAGDNKITAVDFTISDIMLEAGELNAFLDDPQAHAKLFSAPHVGALFTPTMPLLSVLPVKEKIEGVVVELHLTDDITIKLAKADLARISLAREKVGGLTSMSCQVQALPNLDDLSIAQLLKRLDTDIDVTIGQAQGELGLEEAGTDAPSSGDLADAAAAEAQHPEETEA